MAALLLLAVSPLLQAVEPMLVPTPRASILVTTATSRPFLALARTQQVVDAAARGYAESEHLVRGIAGSNQPYATRMLVRRPVDARKFSGRVIVELLDASTQYEAAPLWGFSWEYFIRRGDAWVGLTASPVAAAALKKFNASRYGALDLELTPSWGCAADPQQGSAAELLAQVGALLRSSSKENPLLGFNLQRLFAAGHGAAGDAVTAFATGPHRWLRLGDAAPVFDGYMNVSGVAMAAIDACVPMTGENARRAAFPPQLPFASVFTDQDIRLAPVRAESDGTPDSAFRVYEIAGTAGVRRLPASLPLVTDIAAMGIQAVPETRCRDRLAELSFTYALDAVWQQLDDWLVMKQPMESVAPVIVDSRGTEDGWRMPLVNLPIAGMPANGGARPAQSCDALTGLVPRLDVATLKARYRDRNEYLRRFNAAADQAVMQRLLIKEDADALKAMIARTLPVF